MLMQEASKQENPMRHQIDERRYEFVPRRRLKDVLNQEELAGPIKEDEFRLGIIASRPQKIAQVLETKVSLEGDGEPFFADYRLGPAGHFLPLAGLG